MNVEILCKVIKKNLGPLKGREKGEHKKIEGFQEAITESLNVYPGNDIPWKTEQKKGRRPEQDKIDILGKSEDEKWIIEIDATRADQVAKKILSRVALWGLKFPINYVAILYPDTQTGEKQCKKYLHYGYEVLKQINKKSKVFGVFVYPEKETIELWDYSKSSHFLVNGKCHSKKCNSMIDAAATAVSFYLDEKPHQKFDDLKDDKLFGNFVNYKESGKQYKDIKRTTSDGISVYTSTQFRQYENANWSKFVKICKDNGIIITECPNVEFKS